jgi:hypothetical protein
MPNMPYANYVSMHQARAGIAMETFQPLPASGKDA